LARVAGTRPDYRRAVSVRVFHDVLTGVSRTRSDDEALWGRAVALGGGAGPEGYGEESC
jgi:hypothetical protein